MIPLICLWAVGFVSAFLGVQMTITPPKTGRAKWAYRCSFIVLAVIGLGFTIWQYKLQEVQASKTDDKLSTIDTRTSNTFEYMVRIYNKTIFPSGYPTASNASGVITAGSGHGVITTESGAGGVTSGVGSYHKGSTVTVSATARPGFTFVNWTRGTNVVSTNTTYSFKANGNETLVANFTPIFVSGHN